MKSFVFKIVSVLVLVFLIDLLGGKLMDTLFCDLPATESETSAIYRALFIEKADILVLGSSTASHHYNTKILSNRLAGTSYNAGMDGRDIIYSDIVLQSFISRQVPKYVIIDMGLPNVNGHWKRRINCVQQYYGRNKAVTNFFSEESWQQRMKLRSNVYRYNSTAHSIISMLLIDKKPDSLAGFRPLYGSSSFDFKTEEGFCPDKEDLKHLNSIVKSCKDNNIRLFIVKSPYLINNTTFNQWLKEYCINNEVHLILESEDLFWKNHPELFYDGSHLNAMGADSLTYRICRKIQCFSD